MSSSTIDDKGNTVGFNNNDSIPDEKPDDSIIGQTSQDNILDMEDDEHSVKKSKKGIKGSKKQIKKARSTTKKASKKSKKKTGVYADQFDSHKQAKWMKKSLILYLSQN